MQQTDTLRETPAQNRRAGLTASVGRYMIKHWEAWLHHRDMPQQADTIVVLAGGNGQREAQASRLYRQGYAPTVVVSCAYKEILGYYIDLAALSRRLLMHYGVPSEAIVVQPHRVRSTYDEALGCAALAEERAWRTMLIVSDIYHTRRAILTFRRALSDQHVHVLAVPGERWLASSEDFSLESIVSYVFLETCKLAYYKACNRSD